MTSKFCPEESKVVLSSEALLIFVNQKDKDVFNHNVQKSTTPKPGSIDERPLSSTLHYTVDPEINLEKETKEKVEIFCSMSQKKR